MLNHRCETSFFKGLAHSILNFSVFFRKKTEKYRKRYLRAGWEYGAEIWTHDLSLAKYLILFDEFFFANIFHPPQGSKYSPNESKSAKTIKKPVKTGFRVVLHTLEESDIGYGVWGSHAVRVRWFSNTTYDLL